MDSDDDVTRSFDEPRSATEEESTTLTSPRSGRTIKKQKNASRSSFLMPPSPPTFVTMRQLTEAANAFYNMSLAHEITVDSDFRIEKYEPPEESLEYSVKETMQRAFWDLLRSSLESDPPDYHPALRLLGEIKESLNGLVLPNQKTLQKLIDQSLDLDAAEAQIQQTGHLSLEAYAIQVINVMRQFCAPVRDQEVENLRKIDNPVDAFRNAFLLLEKMHMDLANFTIAQMRPYIRQQAVNYERIKFADFLDAQQVLGIDGLRYTREWIAAAYRRIAPVNTSGAASHSAASVFSSPSFSIGPNRPANHDSQTSDEEVIPTPNNILRESYLALLTWPLNDDWPETVIMDRQRLIDLGAQLVNIVTLTSLVLVVCNYVASNSSQLFISSNGIQVEPNVMIELKRMVCQAGITAFRTAELSSVEERATVLSDEVVFTVERWLQMVISTGTVITANKSKDLPATVKQHVFPDQLRNTLVSQVIEVVHGRHPVYALMHKRALNFLRMALSSHPPEPLPLPPGFSILSDVTRPRNSATDPQLGTNSSPQTVPLMATGIGPQSPAPPIDADETSPKRLQKLEHLSLSNLASRMLPLLAHNRHVFGPKYAEIIQGLLMPSPPTSPTIRRPLSRERKTSRSPSRDMDDDKEREDSTFEFTS